MHSHSTSSDATVEVCAHMHPSTLVYVSHALACHCTAYDAVVVAPVAASRAVVFAVCCDVVVVVWEWSATVAVLCGAADASYCSHAVLAVVCSV